MLTNHAGALGIPKVSWMPNTIGRIKGKGPEDTHEYSFYDTQLDDCVENAFQALALDEKRSPFAPAVWERGRSRNTNLIQVWFPVRPRLPFHKTLTSLTPS